jgi:predicted dehydrogenase
MSGDVLKAGVIGVGSMGQNHARIYSELSGVELVGVADVDEAKAAEVAARCGTESMSMARLLREADMVSIAVSTQYHYQVAKQCLEAGTHVLVEKPFVETIEQGEELIELANANGLVLQVGHIERFNPAVQTMYDILDGIDPIAVECHRVGPPLDRDIETGVIMDLMIHDLDVVLALVDDELVSAAARASKDEQLATAQLEFANGTIGVFTASRVSQRRARTIEITTEDCVVSVDYSSQSVDIHRESRSEYESENGEMHHRKESIIERPFIQTVEPLKEELEAFRDAIVNGTDPIVDGADGLRALALGQTLTQLAAEDEQRTISSPEMINNAIARY